MFEVTVIDCIKFGLYDIYQSSITMENATKNQFGQYMK